jgi:DNA-binding NtrC family response regulator
VASILLIEDDEDLRFTVARALKKEGHAVDEAGAIPDADRLFRERSYDLVVTDVHLGSDSGIDFVERVRKEGFAGGVVVVTAFGTVDDAVRAMKLGADDYLEKPVRLQELTLIVDRLLELRDQRRRLRLYERLEEVGRADHRPLGESPEWKKALTLAERLASMPLVNRADELGSASGGALPTILILGETGAGKGVIARHIHERSREPDGPFVHVNCSALPGTLIEGELFGHEKGAFTDAKEAREGLFEMADGGTIFLDEIGDLPLELQAKLLTVLEHGRVRRVGATKERSVRVRVLAATNQDLRTRVREGRFREDLLFRLNAFTVEIPALRERGDDAVLLANSMLERLRTEYGREPARLTPAGENAVRAHRWDGNVRELFNAVQRAAMLSDGNDIAPADLGLDAARARRLAQGAATENPSGELVFDFNHGRHTADEVEKTLMLQALEHTRGNVSKAARLIGMQRSSFRYRVERYGLERLVQEIAQR